MALSINELVFRLKDLISCQENRPELICFDYFDTIVTRLVEPEHTKHFASKQLSTVLAGQISSSSLYNMRREMEADMCRQNAESGKDPEFNLYDFGSRLFAELNRLSISALSRFGCDDFAELLLDIEVAVEKQVQVCQKELAHLIKEIRKTGIKNCLISDFYLPARSFQQLLHHHGLADCFDAVFISADFGITKGSGRLYDLVLEKSGCSATDVIMIGNSEHADIRMAAEKGIRTFLLDSRAQKQYYIQWESENQDVDKRNQTLKKNLEHAVKANGPRFFPEIGIILWLFTHKLFDQLIQDGVKDVFFCSKEGEFLLRLFEQYQSEMFGRQIIKCHYLLVSRKSTFICSLRPLPEESFSRFFFQYRDTSLLEFLFSLNFSEQESRRICMILGLDHSIRYPDMQNQQVFHTLIQSRVFFEAYEKHRRTQRRNFVAYLDSFDVDIFQEGLKIVDVGWKGSIQDNIFHALKGEVSVCGYYIGILSPTNVYDKNIKKGILFSDHPALTPYFHVFNNNRSLFEMMLGASHGSADGYYKSGCADDVLKSKYHSTYKRISREEDDISVLTYDLAEERKLFQQKIQPMQESFSLLASQLNKIYVGTLATFPDLRWFARHHARMVYYPIRDEIEFFEKLYHLENFGIFQFTDFCVNERLSLVDRIKNLRVVVRDSESVLETGVWPPIILRRLGLGFLCMVDGLRRHWHAFGEW